jgi:hypothetical protein
MNWHHIHGIWQHTERMRHGLIGAVALLAGLSMASLGDAEEGSRDGIKVSGDRVEFTVDVAEDLANKFVPTLVKPTDTEPTRGAWFITEGNIYPADTIEGDGAAFDPNSEGAIGRWFCRGTHLVSASELPDAPLWVDTAQTYFLPSDLYSIITDGLEGNGTILRAMTGGTGKFRGYLGQQQQTFLGFNPSGGVNLRVTFILEKAI